MNTFNVEERFKDTDDKRAFSKSKTLFKVVDDCKRNTKWISYFKSKISFGFQHLGPAYVPNMSSEKTGYAVCTEKVSGWSIPDQVLKELSRGDFEITVQLAFSLFHLNSSTFFGSTWMGPSVSLGNSTSNIPKIIDFDYVDIIYMISRIVDSSCVGVIEIVVSKFDSKRNLVAAQFGCGWTMLNVFGKPVPQDLAANVEIPLMSCAIFFGSPRDLVLNNDIKSLSSKLKEIPNCSLFFRLCRHKRLLKAHHLVSENECIGRFDVVAGLLSRLVIPPGQLNSEERGLACIGDEEHFDDKQGNFCLPAKPILALSCSVKVSNFQLYIPHRAAVERGLIDAVSNKDKSKSNQRLSRRLLIGLHNGHTLLRGEWKSFKLIEDSIDKDMLLTEDAVLELEGYVPNEFMALVIMVQYEEVTAFGNNRSDTATIVKAISNVDVGTSKQAASMTLGMAVFIPSDGNIVYLRNGPEQSKLDKGSAVVNIELPLVNDELSKILSPCKDVDTVLRDLRGQQGDKPEKNDSVKRSVGDATLSQVGFDLNIAHPMEGNLRHGENIELLSSISSHQQLANSLNKTRSYLTGKHSAQLSVSSEQMDSDNEGQYRETQPSNIKTVGSMSTKLFSRMSTETKESNKPSRRLEEVDNNDHYNDDDDSTTGNKSPRNQFNLDSSYYVDKQLSQQLNHHEREQLPRANKNNRNQQSTKSLLDLSLAAKLVPFGDKSARPPQQGEVLIPHWQHDRFAKNSVRAAVTEVPLHVRELSRGAKSRLNRHGFQSSDLDSLRTSVHEANKHVVDLNLETRDILTLNEINIQFAAYRLNSKEKYIVKPKSVFCSFQFYACSPTTTEVMRLAATSAEEDLSVFMRCGSESGPPMSLRYIVDTSCGPPNEALEFAEYLSNSSLFVDLWDGDSLFLLGTFAIPLKKLLRQSRHMVKQVLECDVVRDDCSYSGDGGVVTTVVAEGGQVMGSIMGSVQVILSNYGQRGTFDAGENPRQGKTLVEKNEGFNWRTCADDSRDINNLTHRPRHCIRARPLSESSPQLSQALQGLRASHLTGEDNGSTLRSLTAHRGVNNLCTLTYDEVSILFKRFQGQIKGSIQYVGDLMILLDMPSWAMALRRYLKACRKLGGSEKIAKLTSKYCGADNSMGLRDIEELMSEVFALCEMAGRSDDHILLATKLIADRGVHGVISRNVFLKWCDHELDGEEWTLCSRRLRLAVDSAYIAGEDVQQKLCESDSEGAHTIHTDKFRSFLKYLSGYGKLSDSDVSLCLKHFSEMVGHKHVVSLKHFMATVGRDYVGNIPARIQKALRGKLSSNGTDLLALLGKHAHIDADKRNSASRSFTFRVIESALGELGVFSEVTHEQLVLAMKSIDVRHSGSLSTKQVFALVGADFSVAQVKTGAAGDQFSGGLSGETLTIESMLRILLDKVQSNGLAVDEAFRHFDINGDGLISISELELALDNLRIFQSIPNWKQQIPQLLEKFDTSRDGQVSLMEFFRFLGITKDYTPNIVQKMTHIFAIATQKGLSVANIFAELDADKGGSLSASELQLGLTKIGTFGEITLSDAQTVVTIFDSNGDGRVSTEEFVGFFSKRIAQSLRDRAIRALEKQPAVKQFRDVMKAAQSKGLTTQLLFKHLDSDGGGTISQTEFVDKLAKLPNFKDMAPGRLQEVFSLIDVDHSNEISLEELERFLRNNDGNDIVPHHSQNLSMIDRVKDIYKTAMVKGLSFEQAFALADSNGNGQLSLRELENCLRKLPMFKDSENHEFKRLFDVIDVDGRGLINIEEFKAFVSEGKDVYKRNIQRNSRDLVQENETLSNEEFNSAVARFVNKFIATDSRFITRLDDDDMDGLISVDDLMYVLRSKDLFSEFSEHRVLELLTSFKTQQSFIAIDQFLSFLSTGRVSEQRSGTPNKIKDFDTEVQENETLLRDYEFSSDPEVRTLEKKIRMFGKLLAKRGVDVESMFRQYDTSGTGMVRRSELIEVLSKMGMYILEQGQSFDAALFPGDDLSRHQIRQINRLKGSGGDYIQNAPRLARRALLSNNAASNANSFTEHVESMSLISSYRSSQKQTLLHRVLSQNLQHVVNIFPRFGSTLFFEYPFTNPFGHEERFQIEISDPELRIVTAFEEWLHLRNNCRVCVGEMGTDPVEAEMFDRDGSNGHIQVILLPFETLHLPFTFLTLMPFAMKEDDNSNIHSFRGERKSDDKQGFPHKKPSRSTEVKFISSTHGHIVSILRVDVFPVPFVLHRTLHFYANEKSVLKRRILLVDHDNKNSFPHHHQSDGSKYIHCVECNGQSSLDSHSRVVVEWGPSSEQFAGSGTLDILIRYRCEAFPGSGSFYLLIFSDPYQCQLFEIWHLIVETRQRLDIQGSVGSPVSTDLVVRGDRFPRRARAFIMSNSSDRVHCHPESVFQLIPGAYNRVSLTVLPRSSGHRQVQVHLIDTDSRQLISAWLLTLYVTNPAAMQKYDVKLGVRPMHKKIVYSNPWDVTRRFTLISSDDNFMRPRNSALEVGPRGTAFIRLWFRGLDNMSSSSSCESADVHLFLNDAEGGQSEECYLFHIN